jgi:hypothetical protein
VSHRSKKTYSPKALWRRTAFDVSSWWRKRPNKWEARAERLTKGREELEQEVLDSRRLPAESDRERGQYPEDRDFEERLDRCLAFGQWATRAETDEQNRDAQHGLFGTCAAIQVLSKSARVTDACKGDPVAAHTPWVKDYLETVNFLDLIAKYYREGGDPELEVKVAAELNVTLRACHAVRALAAAKPVLADLQASDGDIAAGFGREAREVRADLGGDLGKVVPRIAAKMLATLEEVSVPQRDARGRFRPKGAHDTTKLYCFTAVGDEKRDRPDNVDDWVFLYGSVLAAVARAWAAELTTDGDAIGRICPSDDFYIFVDHMKKPPADLDVRLRLFGLWALSHFDQKTLGGPLRAEADEKVEVPRVMYEAVEGAWLKEAIIEVCGELLDSAIRQADTFSPYSFRIDEAADYKTDSLVVPVVPLLLSLIARYEHANLCRQSVLHLIHGCLEKGARTSEHAARPFQLSTRDGIVNLSYYQEAYQELALASTQIAASRSRRFSTHLRAVYRDFGPYKTALSILLVAVLFAFVAAFSKLWFAAFVAGILTSSVAAVGSYGLVLWIWGDS